VDARASRSREEGEGARSATEDLILHTPINIHRLLMAYIKLIQSGNLIERYAFERTPNPVPFALRMPRKRRIFPQQERSPESLTRCRNSFRRLVRANLSSKTPPALITLTMRDIVEIDVAYKAYSKFAWKFRRRYGYDSIGMIAVPEFQKRGAVHFHILVFNLKYESYKNERRTRQIASLWEHGFVDVKRTDGNEKLSSYLAKYMSKAMQDYRLVRRRAYSASGRVVRTVSLNTPFQVKEATLLWDLGGVDNPPTENREYDTLWLGRCVYQKFVLNGYEDSNNP